MQKGFRLLRVLVCSRGDGAAGRVGRGESRDIRAAGTAVHLPGTRGGADSVTLDRFLLNGQPVTAANRLQVRQLAAGVNEITAQSSAAGDWEFDLPTRAAITDLASATIA